MITKVAWGFPTPSLPRAETYVDLHLECPLFSELNQNWNVSANVSETPQYQSSAVLKLLHAYRQTDGQSYSNERTARLQTCLKIRKYVFSSL
jgi:hypothetical protein